jgi:hypothetical protein
VPRYMVISETGPDHDKRFETSLVIRERVIATGMGRSKKEAEQQAARMALEELRKIEPVPTTGEATVSEIRGTQPPVAKEPSSTETDEPCR